MKTKENSKLRKQLQERVEEVQEFYLSGKTIKETADKFGLSTSTMTRFLKDNNINKGRRDLKDPETLDNLRNQLEELLKTNSVTKSCKILGINHELYCKIMKLISQSTVNRELKNEFNNELISLDNPIFCYLLGLFISDGHIDDDRICIYQADAKFLKKLQKFIGHKGVLNKCTNASNPCYRLTLTSDKLRNFLSSYSIQSNKKLNAPYIDCGINSKHFIRGLFDGDGCLYYLYVSGYLKERRWSISTGSPYVKDGVVSFLHDHNINCTITTSNNKNICYNIFIDSIKDIITLSHILYDKANDMFLDRKYYSFVKFEELVKINQKVNEIVEHKLKDL